MRELAEAGMDVLCKNYRGNNVLHIAVQLNHLEIVQMLLDSAFPIEDENYDVKLLLGIHPDDNMIISLNADYFIGSGGSYSNLLSQITNGIVI